MDIKSELKRLYHTIDICDAAIDGVALFRNKGVTFDELETVLRYIWISIKDIRDELEYEDLKSYYAHKKKCDVGNEVIPELYDPTRETEKQRQIAN